MSGNMPSKQAVIETAKELEKAREHLSMNQKGIEGRGGFGIRGFLVFAQLHKFFSRLSGPFKAGPIQNIGLFLE